MTASHAQSVGQWRELVDSGDRREFVASVRGHLGSRFGPDSVRDCFDAGQPVKLWSEIADPEYTLIGLPESMGGVGSLVDTVALIEAAGHALVPLPLLSTVMAWQTLSLADDTRAIAPDRIAALAVVDEPEPGSAADRLAVPDGALAHELVVVDAAASSTAVVSTASVRTAPVDVHRHVDPSRPLAVFDHASLSPIPAAEAQAAPEELLAPARTVLAADLTGVGAVALDRAVQHANEREQFGKTIGAFQGIKHRLADVYVAVERARSLTRAAAVTISGGVAGDVSGIELSLLAKAAAADAAVESTRAYIQVLGAMGMTFEADAHLFFRRAEQTAPVLGSAATCYRRAAQIRQERMG